MAEGNDRTPSRMRGVPPLPRGLANPTPVVLAGTALWFAGLVVFGVQGWAAGGLDGRFWTSLVGFVLGIAGYGLFRWQRRASTRGSRGAWRGSGLEK